MSDNVVGLPGIEVKPPDVTSDDIFKQLEDAIRHAKNSKMVAIGIVMIDHDHQPLLYEHHDWRKRPVLAGGAAVLLHTITTDIVKTLVDVSEPKEPK